MIQGGEGPGREEGGIYRGRGDRGREGEGMEGRGRVGDGGKEGMREGERSARYEIHRGA